MMINLKKISVSSLVILTFLFGFSRSAQANCAEQGLNGSNCCAQDESDPICQAFLNGSQDFCNSSSCGLGQTCNIVTGQCENIPAPNVGGSGDVPSLPPGSSVGNGSNAQPPAGLLCPTGLEYSNGLCLPPNNQGGFAGTKSLVDLILLVIQLLLTFAGLIGVVVLIVGGYWYITAAGNEETSEKGKKAILSAIIGLVVVLMSYAIVAIVSGTLTTNNFLQ